MRPDGSDRHAVTNQRAETFNPAWSPDSARIVFSSNKDSEVYALYTVVSTGRACDASSPTAGDNFEPSWSPDGTKIAYQEGGAIFTVELGAATSRSSPIRRTTTRLRPGTLSRRRATARLRTCRSARTRRAAASRRARRRGSRSRSRPSARPRRARPPRSRRHDDDAVVVAHDPVARLDRARADRHGNLRRLELPAPRRVLGRDEAAEDGEALVEDEADVAAAAVEDAAGDAACLERRHRELAEMRRDVVVACIDGDMTLGTSPSIASTFRIASSYAAASWFEAGPPFTV